MKTISLIFIITLCSFFSSLAFADQPLSFDNFLFKEKGSCLLPKQLSFNASKNTYIIDGYAENEKKQELSVSVFIQLLDNGQYWARYKERTKVEQFENIHVYVKTFQKILTGEYRIEGEEIFLEGIGSGFVFDAGTSSLVQIKMEHVINDPRTLGHLFYLNKISTSQGPFGQSKQDYCQSKL